MPPWLVSLATIAFANALVVLRPDHPVARRSGAVRAGPVLRDRRLHGGAARALYAGARRVRLWCWPALVAAGWWHSWSDSCWRAIAKSSSPCSASRMSMILYGVLVKIRDARARPTASMSRPARFFGYQAAGRDPANLALFWLVLGVFGARRLAGAPISARSPASWPVPIRDNEIRVEYLGISVNRLDPSQAGDFRRRWPASAARWRRSSFGHVDPQMAYWTTSGGFVFVTILAGAGSVAGGVRRARCCSRSCAPSRSTCSPGTLADDPRIGTAADHPVPARGARLAGSSRQTRAPFREAAHERDALRQRPGKDLRLGRRRARHQRRRAGRGRPSASSAPTAPARPRSST